MQPQIVDIYEIRRVNLKWLIDTEFGGKLRSFAARIGLQPSAVSAFFSQTRHRRNVGDEIARRVEKELGRPAGWLDVQHLFPTDGDGDTAAAIHNAVVVNPYGHKAVPVVDAKTAWEWTRSDAPYPVTRSTEMLWVTRKGISDRAFGLILLGDNSMADEFMVGDIAIIDPEEAPAPGDYVAARLDAEKAVVLRKYRLREVDATGLHHIDLIPINPDYPTITITSRDPKQILWPMLECRKFRLASGTRRRF